MNRSISVAYQCLHLDVTLFAGSDSVYHNESYQEGSGYILMACCLRNES